jgi:Skp family chaperone for outer membrane proteins
MKVSRLLASTLLIAAAFAISVTAQDAEAPAVKVVFINTAAFEGKDGITKYVRALDLAFGEPGFVLHSMQAKMEALAKESNEIRDRLNSSPPSFRTEGLTQKLLANIDELNRLDIEVNRKEQDAKAGFERRKDEVLTPIRKDIHRAMEEFATQNGYSVILDATKLEYAMLAYDAAKVDVTKEFIAFYNARTVTAAPKPY